MRNKISSFFAVAEPKGHTENIEQLVNLATKHQVDALVVLGDLAGPSSKPDTFAKLFKILGSANPPVYYIPGPDDMPVSEYLREAYNMELVYPYMHGVHGTFAFALGHVVFAGMGGEILDEMQAEREEIQRLRYAGWEVEYRLKILHELKDYPKIFLFTTYPHHRGLKQPGSEVLAELIKTHNPQVVIARHPVFQQNRLGKSLLVSPGLLTEGKAAIVNLRERRAEPITL